MTTNRSSRIASFVGTILLLLGVSTVVAGRASNEQARHGWEEIEINLLKWVTTPQGAMAGFVGGDGAVDGFGQSAMRGDEIGHGAISS